MANIYSFSANYEFKTISQYELLFNMNNNYKFDSLLPDELERIKKLVDNLLNNKLNDRLTNQEYQKDNIDIRCPSCKDINYKKNGHKNGTQRYLCKKCKKSFSITTNTILRYSKITYQQLMLFIKCLLDSKSLNEISFELNISKTQVYYQEMKLFLALEDTYNNQKLKGIVQVDEKYFRISFKGTKHKDMPRKTRHSGSQDLKVGINKELACVVLAIDENDNIIIKVVGNGPASSQMIGKALNNKIEEGSIIITDSKSAYIKFASDNNLILKQIPDGEYTVDDIYNLNDLNELILELESYVIYNKKGVSTKHLQQYCNFIKYKKILKYTYEYLDRNKEMYIKSIGLFSTMTNNQVCKSEMPFSINNIFD